MIEQDEMFRTLVFRYAPKLAKTKKQASYILQKKVQTKQIPLKEAIALKSDVNKMQDTYNPLAVQKYWDTWWNQNGFFTADNQSKKQSFVICLPPPNVTGYLHIGHALTVAIQDSIIRRKRMQGYETLYIPGSDHAGIATQTVVEKALQKQTGKTRHDLGREDFIKKVWEWKQVHGNRIHDQLRRVGASLDWSRQVFTMDQHLSTSVVEAFVRLFERGLIYRANRLVNWSTILKTAISDIEVQHIDIEKRTLLEVPGYDKKVQFGVMVHFVYKRRDDPTKQLQIATTRIETMLGDVAIAVHPEDQRFKDWIGKQLIHPFIQDRKIIVIADDFVQRDFGTGAVKITPAHDPNDYQCGMRHKLQFINILTQDGKINENGGKFAGLKRFDCRRVIEQELRKLNLIKDKKDHKMRLGTCQRSKDIIEPVIKPQWYVKCQQISKRMMEVVQNKQLKITPAHQEQTWYKWVGNLRDWCISRQLWWGHRIPAYLAYKKGTNPPNSQNSENWIAARSKQEALEIAQKKLKLDKQEIEIQQDPDVLDTWFSSGLFPFSPLKWPNQGHPDFKAFFPNTILQTGHDILFFWVARMVMMSLWLTDKLPFKQTLLHPMVCDSQGNKMSKTRGNVIDPLQIIEGTSLENLIQKIRQSNLPKGQQDKSIKKLKHEFPEGMSQCGSDALRFGLLAYMTQTRKINLNINRIIAYRKFCNKIWNTFKFIIPKFQHIKKFDVNQLDPTKQNFLNSWILGKLNKAIQLINKNFQMYNLGDAANVFYNFWLYELCDIYLQATKPIFISGNDQIKQRTALTLFMCLEVGLRLLQPMMPFLSQQLYQKLPQFQGKAKACCIAPYPEPMKNVDDHFTKIQEQFQICNNYAAALRAIASSVNLPPTIKAQAFLITQDKIVKEQTALILALGKCSKIYIIENQKQIPKGCGMANIGANKIYLNLGKYIDINKQLERMDKSLAEKRKFIQKLIEKINDKNRDKKPQELREKQDSQLKTLQEEQGIILNAIQKLKDIK